MQKRFGYGNIKNIRGGSREGKGTLGIINLVTYLTRATPRSTHSFSNSIHILQI